MGELDTADFRVFAEGGNISMWHDIKLFPTHEAKSHKVVNMICEIPKCSRKKYEVRCLCTVYAFSLSQYVILDRYQRARQPHQAGHQEGQAARVPKG
jgi:hypothetical protein